MPFDAIAVSAVVSELTDKIAGGKIEKVHQPEKDEIRLFVKCDKKNYILLISADSQNPRIHLTEHTKQNPMEAPMFCMLLRKHIGGGRIKSITQPSFERIVDIEVEGRNELGDLTQCHVIAEIMGRHSNIVLVQNDKIIDSAKRIDLSVSTVRHLLPGLTYQLPPAQDKINPLKAEEKEYFEALLKVSDETPIDKSIVKTFLGTSPLFGREVSFLATGESDGRLSGQNILKTADVLNMQFEKIKNGCFEPCVIEDAKSEKMIDFAAYNVSYFGSLSKVHKFETISGAMDTFFLRRDLWERMRGKSASVRKTVSNALERCRKKAVLHQEKLAECEKADTFRIYGDLITANLYRLSQGEEEAQLENYYDNNNIVEISMDKSKSPQKNAAAYYTKYRKLKTAKEVVGEQQEKNLAEIEYLERVMGSIDIAESEKDISEIREELSAMHYIKTEQKKGKRREKPSEPLKFEYEGYEILVGRNNRQNDLLTCRMGRSYDMWLHTKDIPGSHVLIRNQNVEIPDKIIEYAATLAAYYSSGRENSMVAVDYTIIKNVKKPAGAMPGKVIYDKYKTAYVSPAKMEV